MTSLHTTLRRVGAGRLLYAFWHSPRACVARSVREGGPFEQWIDRRGRRAMMRAATSLPVSAVAEPGAPAVHFLTGRKFWYQTAFCAWSLNRTAGKAFRFVLHDDGSFDNALASEARRLFPGAEIVSLATTEARLDRVLPAARFPTLRQQRTSYIHLRKLTDIHAGGHGWNTVLDSDMLFFRRPAALLDWFAAPSGPVHLVDVFDSYGYPRNALQALISPPLPARVNVGICGLPSDQLDWPQIEHWCAALLAAHGTSYYLEQALLALILAGQSGVQLPTADYRVLPDEAECRAPRAVLHHYVAESKRGYFRHAWRHAHERLATA